MPVCHLPGPIPRDIAHDKPAPQASARKHRAFARAQEAPLASLRDHRTRVPETWRMSRAGRCTVAWASNAANIRGALCERLR